MVIALAGTVATGKKVGGQGTALETHGHALVRGNRIGEVFMMSLQIGAVDGLRRDWAGYLVLEGTRTQVSARRIKKHAKQVTWAGDRREDSEVSMRDQAKWQELLVEAVNEPGRIMTAYTAFHNYSIGNALLALSQCVQRKLTPGPLNTFKGWQELGRYVKKGERALTLCMPVTAKKKRINPETKVEDEQVLMYFVYRPNWFVLSQTDGATPYVLPTPGFEFDTALNNLDIRRLEFDIIDGNVQGFARDRGIAINPVAQLPHKTTFHELAHIVLGHTQQAVMVESDATPRCIREVEAESVALICCEALGLPGIAYCRGYLQFWLRDEKEIPAQSAQRIFCAATAILKAGSERPRANN